jgi:hypothetical protein
MVTWNGNFRSQEVLCMCGVSGNLQTSDKVAETIVLAPGSFLQFQHHKGLKYMIARSQDLAPNKQPAQSWHDCLSGRSWKALH